MKEKEKVNRDWKDPEVSQILDGIEEASETIIRTEKTIEADVKNLQKLARKNNDDTLLEDLEESLYYLSSINDEIEAFLEHIRDSHTPEACNLLQVLDKNIGDLR